MKRWSSGRPSGCDRFTPDRERNRKNCGSQEQANDPKSLEPAEDAEQGPEERQADRTADQRGACGVIDDENRNEAGTQQHQPDDEMRADDQGQRGDGEHHRCSEWHDTENCRRQRKGDGMGDPANRVSDAEKDPFDQADEDKPVDGRAHGDDAEPAVFRRGLSEETQAEPLRIGCNTSAVLIEEQQRQERKAEDHKPPGDETSDVSAKAERLRGLGRIDDTAAASGVFTGSLAFPNETIVPTDPPGGPYSWAGSAYNPANRAAAHGASQLVNGVQIIPFAPGWNPNATVLQSIYTEIQGSIATINTLNKIS